MNIISMPNQKYLSLIGISILISFFISACIQEKKEPCKKLQVVTYELFKSFVDSTNYITDAEKYGWSIVQTDAFNFISKEGANWRKPNGENPPLSKELPVTQVSYNDAVAYCKWKGTKLPTYNQYWKLSENDNRKVITNSNAPISAANQANILGNVWEITTTTRGEEIRLAGGSLFCSPKICHGTSRDRELFVDKQTGNVHIGFAVITE